MTEVAKRKNSPLNASRSSANKRSHVQHDDSVPHPLLLDSFDAAHYVDVMSTVKDLEERTNKSGLPAERHTELR